MTASGPSPAAGPTPKDASHRLEVEGYPRLRPSKAAIKAIIRESVAAAGTTGFVTGLGGLMVMSLMVPANMAGNLAVNSRMVGAIAHLRGHPLEDPLTRTAILLTVAGSNLQAAAAELGVTLGKQAAKKAIEAIPMAVIHRINARAGLFLVAKYGTQRSAVTLARAIPIAGGLVGGSVDATLTGVIGTAARKHSPTNTTDLGRSLGPPLVLISLCTPPFWRAAGC